VHDLAERVQPRKILHSYAKILLPSKRPFIELATRAPPAIQSKPVFHSETAKPFHFCSGVYRLAAAPQPV
jgi:hypothetical protein